MSRDDGLRQMLADLAHDVTVVDLSERVAATSRSQRLRRQVLTYAGAFLAVVAVGAGTIIATANRQPQLNPATVPPSASGPSSGVTSSAAAPSSTVSSAPSVSAAPGPLFPALSGASLYYLGENAVHILGVDGSRQVPYRGIISRHDAAVSPDGALLAWCSGDDLIVANVDGSGARAVTTGVDCRGDARIPVWLPDGQRLLFYPSDATQRKQVVIATGTVSDTPFGDALYLAFSPNGQYAGYEQDGEIVVVRAGDGSVVRRVAHHDEGLPGFSVQGISDDGRYAVAGIDDSDPGILRSGHQVVDTVTGADVGLPGAGGTNPLAIAVYPLPAGQWLVRRASDPVLSIVSAQAEVVGNVTEPVEVSQIGWLRVVPS